MRYNQILETKQILSAISIARQELKRIGYAEELVGLIVNNEVYTDKRRFELNYLIEKILLPQLEQHMRNTLKNSEYKLKRVG